ncbi:hypothetical protein D3C80_1127150 [compost metagenome]
MAADQPRLDLVPGRLGDHGADVVVVAVGFVDEALAVGEHADDAGLGPIDDVWEMPNAAVRVRHPRHRRPSHRAVQVIGNLAANAFAQAQAVTVSAQRRQGQVLVAGGCSREQRLAPFDVIGKAAGGQYHGLAGMDADRPAGGFNNGTAYPALILDQLASRC